MTPVGKYYSLTGQRAVQAMRKRGMDAYYCETKEEALETAVSLIPAESRVAWGGSRTLNEIGLLEWLRTGQYSVIDRDAAPTPEEKRKRDMEALSADYYLMSTNAITEDGVLVNIDGNGNRAAALIFGPEHVIVVAGVNKLAANEEAAVARARKIAAPMNAIRLQRNTPCVTTGICQNCTEDECVCRHMVLTRMSNGKNRIKVILIGESAGF